MPRLVRPPKPRERFAPRFLTVDQYCDAKQISRASAYNAMRAGRVPYDVSDGHRRIPISVIDRQEQEAFARIAKAKG